MPDGSALDIPVWSSLAGDHARLAERGPGAARYDPAITGFAAVDPDGPPDWTALARLLGAGGECYVAGDPVEPPTGWRQAWRIDGFQMVGDRVAGETAPDAVVLGADDAADMVALADLTRPGPFGARTHELGRFVGIRREGRLVAMSGERMAPAGHVEVSAVCTHPDARGQGFAAALVRDVCASIVARDRTPILHVAGVNTGAIRLYETLGFAVRRRITFQGLRAPAA